MEVTDSMIDVACAAANDPALMGSHTDYCGTRMMKAALEAVFNNRKSAKIAHCNPLKPVYGKYWQGDNVTEVNYPYYCLCLGTIYKSKEINGSHYAVCTICDLPQNPKAVSAQPEPDNEGCKCETPFVTKYDGKQYCGSCHKFIKEEPKEQCGHNYTQNPGDVVLECDKCSAIYWGKPKEKTPTLLEEMDIKAGYKGELLPKDAAMRREVYRNVSEYLDKYMMRKE